MKQLALKVNLPSYATFDTFVSHGNEALIAALKGVTKVPEQGEMLFVSGAHASGKTHLLQASCLDVNKSKTSIYLDLANEDMTPAVLQGWDHVALICLDNIHVAMSLSDSTEWQEALFDLYNQRLQRDDNTKASLVVSSRLPLSELPIQLKDLSSRLSSSLVYQINELEERHLPMALFVHANQRGFEIPKETSEYLLKRLPRDLKLLVNTIDEFDKASLEAKRKLSIPFVKSILD